MMEDDLPFGDLTRVERDIDAANASIRRFAERSRYFRACLDSDPELLSRRVRLALGLTHLKTALSEDIRAIVAYRVDIDLEAVGIHVRRERHKRIALAMRRDEDLTLSSGTINNKITRGKILWDKLTRQVVAGADDEPDARDAKREATALSEAARALIDRTLIEMDVGGEIDAVEKADRKAHLPMLSHAIMRMLDTLGRSADDPTRRMLAAMSAEAQKQWCADQIRAAVAGTPEHYQALVRECVAQRAKERKSVKSNCLTEKAA